MGNDFKKETLGIRSIFFNSSFGYKRRKTGNSKELSKGMVFVDEGMLGSKSCKTTHHEKNCSRFGKNLVSFVSFICVKKIKVAYSSRDGIHTIEFVLGATSNTRLRRRIWFEKVTLPMKHSCWKKNFVFVAWV